MEAAIKILREKGELKAQTKMATRIAADGIVDILKKGDFTAMIEVNTETDFVAKNESFQAFVKDLLNIIIDQKPADVDALMNCAYDAEMTVDAKMKEMIISAHREGKDVEEIKQLVKDTYYTDIIRKGQPEKAFDLNNRYMVPMIIREFCE